MNVVCCANWLPGGFSQKNMAKLMGTTLSALVRLEHSEIDPELFTFERYAQSPGLSV